jgi:hypothetical protein
MTPQNVAYETERLIAEALYHRSRERTAAYIEVVTDTYAAPPAAKKMHENIKTLYRLGEP